MLDKSRQRLVRVIGHKNPDTDSICSAIGYAYLKNQITKIPHEARRAGEISPETAFALRHFHTGWPRLSEDVSPTIHNVDIHQIDSIPENMSLRTAWKTMIKNDLDTLCVADSEGYLKGIITIKDIAGANMNIFDSSILSSSRAGLENVINTLEGKLLCGDGNEIITRGKIVVGASPEAMRGHAEKGDIVLVTNNYEDQVCAVECGAGCIIVCMDEGYPEMLVLLAKEKNISVIQTSFDTYTAVRMISMAAPVSYFMKKEGLVTFHLDTPASEAQRVMANLRYRYFPVLDKNDRCVGVVSRRNFLNMHKKKVILVDHNEKSQAVDGLEDAELLEIIDHHRIGNLETGNPVYFRNEPVGCTATIIYDMFNENQVEIPGNIAGLLLSAILSDTLIFHSPTCTLRDVDAANALAKICGEDAISYGRQMFEAGEDLTGRSGEEIMNRDCKEFILGDHNICVGQGIFVSDRAYSEAKTLIEKYMKNPAQRDGVDMQFYMLTSIEDRSTFLIFEGKGAAEIVDEAFNVKSRDGEVLLEDVVSRKKQLIPPLREKILAM